MSANEFTLQGSSIFEISSTSSVEVQQYPNLIPGNAKNLVAALMIATFLYPSSLKSSILS